MGLVADAVEEVLNVGQNDAAPPPEFGCAVDVTFLRGMARMRGEVKTLLDIDRVVKGDELAAAIEAAA
jgi:purine-binding chemotaxis protein CheW